MNETIINVCIFNYKYILPILNKVDIQINSKKTNKCYVEYKREFLFKLFLSTSLSCIFSDYEYH